jgi:NTE family protein
MKPDWALFTYLFNAGRDEASKWVGNHLASVGHRSSVDLAARFLKERDDADQPADDAEPMPKAATGTSE